MITDEFRERFKDADCDSVSVCEDYLSFGMEKERSSPALADFRRLLARGFSPKAALMAVLECRTEDEDSEVTKCDTEGTVQNAEGTGHDASTKQA